MDGQRFDALARALSKGVSRRAVWRGLLGTGVGSLFAASVQSARAQVGCGTSGEQCPPGTTCVDSQCCDNQNNCCVTNFSTCSGVAPCCGAPDFDCCDGVCTTLLFDRANCGSCGNGCAQGQVCCNGSCCDGMCCGGGTVCVPPLDPNNCETCGDVCGPCESCQAVFGGQICATTCTEFENCEEGDCVSCPSGLIACNGGCLDPSFDDDNCGSCGNSCDGKCDAGLGCGQICVEGNCRCPAGEVICGDEFPSCSDTSTHPLHCGDCFNECAEGESCVEGICTTSGGVQETPTAGPAEPSPVAQPTEEQGVSGLPSTGSGPRPRGFGDARIPLFGAGAAICAAAIARLTRRVPKSDED